MKKSICLSLCALLAFGVLLTACGDSDSSTSSDYEKDVESSEVTSDIPSVDSTTTSGDGTESITAEGTSASKPVSTTKNAGGDKTPSKSNTTTSAIVSNTTLSNSANNDSSMLLVQDGVLYQPKDGKYNNFIKYRDTLGNTYSKLTSGKKLKVVYSGGSVTVGDGATNKETTSWRALTGKWIKDTFPNAEVKNVNRGIGGTGTCLASYRYERDIVAENPDLVFIEYAINDAYDNVTYMQAASQYETIVRGIRQKLPECDIVTVLVIDENCRGAYLHQQAQAHEDVSIAYKIPTVHVGLALAKHLSDNVSTAKWTDYMTDIVHPNDKGHDFYHQIIREFLDNCLVDYPHSGKVVKHTLPAQQCAVLNVGNVTVIEPTAALITRSEALGGKGFRIVDVPVGAAEYYERYLLSNSKDAEIVIEFTGTELAMMSFVTGIEKYKIKVDDGKYTTKNFRGRYSPTMVLVSDLPSGKHTVRIQPINNVGSRCSLQIAAFYSRDAKGSRK